MEFGSNLNDAVKCVTETFSLDEQRNGFELLFEMACKPLSLNNWSNEISQLATSIIENFFVPHLAFNLNSFCEDIQAKAAIITLKIVESGHEGVVSLLEYNTIDPLMRLIQNFTRCENSGHSSLVSAFVAVKSLLYITAEIEIIMETDPIEVLREENIPKMHYDTVRELVSTLMDIFTWIATFGHSCLESLGEGGTQNREEQGMLETTLDTLQNLLGAWEKRDSLMAPYFETDQQPTENKVANLMQKHRGFEYFREIARGQLCFQKETISLQVQPLVCTSSGQNTKNHSPPSSAMTHQRNSFYKNTDPRASATQPPPMMEPVTLKVNAVERRRSHKVFPFSSSFRKGRSQEEKKNDES
mmetsp:Transcript_17509/g.22474  ORF Transcript_17509/g.22474 Transcript_17509/m.22474 type:complete len:358 (-) Transcript_17509:131-1204(-)